MHLHSETFAGLSLFFIVGDWIYSALGKNDLVNMQSESFHDTGVILGSIFSKQMLKSLLFATAVFW